MAMGKNILGKDHPHGVNMGRNLEDFIKGKEK